MGRYTTTNQDKIAHGTDQPVRMRQEVGFTKVERIYPHPELTGRAWKIYKVIASEFIARGVLEEINDSLVSAYAQEMAVYWDMTSALITEGYIIKVLTKAGVVPVVNPKRKLQSDALANATRLGIQFGITPASRAKIAAMISGNDKKYDEFAEFE